MFSILRARLFPMYIPFFSFHFFFNHFCRRDGKNVSSYQRKDWLHIISKRNEKKDLANDFMFRSTLNCDGRIHKYVTTFSFCFNPVGNVNIQIRKTIFREKNALFKYIICMYTYIRLRIFMHIKIMLNNIYPKLYLCYSLIER